MLLASNERVTLAFSYYLSKAAVSAEWGQNSRRDESDIPLITANNVGGLTCPCWMSLHTTIMVADAPAPEIIDIHYAEIGNDHASYCVVAISSGRRHAMAATDDDGVIWKLVKFHRVVNL